MADSISRITVFVAFMWSGLIPWWMLLVFIYRDSAVATMRTVCAFRGEVVAARRSGKIKAIVQATAIITILVARIANSLFPQYLNESFVSQLAWWLMLVTTLYTAFSLYEYLNATPYLAEGGASSWRAALMPRPLAELSPRPGCRITLPVHGYRRHGFHRWTYHRRGYNALWRAHDAGLLVVL